MGQIHVVTKVKLTSTIEVEAQAGMCLVRSTSEPERYLVIPQSDFDVDFLVGCCNKCMEAALQRLWKGTPVAAFVYEL